MRDIATKADNVGDTLSAGAFNAQENELENIVTSSDQSLDPGAGPDTDLNMLSKAVAAYANAGNIYQDSGVANSYVLSLSTNLKSVVKYYDNMMVLFKAGNANTGGSTININALGAKSLTLPGGTALPSGYIRADNYITAVYNASADRFELVGAGEAISLLIYGFTFDDTTLSAALTAAGSSDVEFFVPAGDWDITNNVTIPSNVTLNIANGAKFKSSTSATLTWNGGLKSGPDQHIFDSTLTVSGSPRIWAVFPEWFGAVGDGVTDDSTPIQAAIDFADNRVVLLNNYIAADLSIASKNNFTIINSGTLKLPTVLGGTSLMTISGSSNIIVRNGQWDANVADNGATLQEHTHIIEIHGGCSDVHIKGIEGINIAGDGIYINSSLGSGVLSERIYINNCSFVSSDTGRKGVSIITAKKVYIDDVVIDGVGTSTMPGGIDLEPNAAGDYIEDIYISNVYINHNGQVGLGLFGSVKTIKNVFIDNAHVVHNSAGFCFRTLNAEDVTVNNLIVNGQALVDNSTRVFISNYRQFNGNAFNIDESSYVSIENFHISDSIDHLINVNLSAVASDHIYIRNGTLENADTDLDLTGMGIVMRGTVDTIVIEGVVFEKGNTVAGIQNNGTITNGRIINCDLSQFTLDKTLISCGDFDKINNKGVNYLSTTPTASTWKQGDIVYNTAPAEDANSMVTLGWICTTAGTPGTWRPMNVSTVSPAV